MLPTHDFYQVTLRVSVVLGDYLEKKLENCVVFSGWKLESRQHVGTEWTEVLFLLQLLSVSPWCRHDLLTFW